MKNNDNKVFWQRIAALYGPFMRGSARAYEATANAIRPHLTPDMQVLELACGSGQLSFLLADAVQRWEATDFSEKMVTQAQKCFAPTSLHFSVQDATSLPYADGSFDAVLIANALHIMPAPEKAMAQIARVLRPGGLLFAPTFVRTDAPGERRKQRLMELIGFKTFHGWDAAGLCDFVAGYGFSVLESPLISGSTFPICCLTARRRSAVNDQ